MDEERMEGEQLEKIIHEFAPEVPLKDAMEDMVQDQTEISLLDDTEEIALTIQQEQEIQEKALPQKPKKNKKLPLMIAAVVLVLAAIAAGVIFTQFVFAGGSMYSIRSETLDLRGKEITEADFLHLTEEMPQCQITWDVPFQGGKVANDSTELTVTTLTEEDIRVLDYVTGLKKVDGYGCSDYMQLVKLQQHRKSLEVLYTVPVAGNSYPQDTRELVLDSLSAEDVEVLPALLQLEKVEVSNCEDYALLQKIQAEQPQWNLTYTVAAGEDVFAWDSQEVQVTGLTAEELATVMEGLPHLKKLDLTNTLANHMELAALRELYPNVKLNWTVEMFGQTFTEETTEVNISGNIVEACEDVEKLVACLPNLKKLIMSDCGIDSETMAQFRERQRANYKVVWTVYIGEICKVRTDEIFFHPIQQGEYYMWDEDTPELKYCEDMICVDVGHHKIRNIDFCRYMPELKYLILAHTLIRDVSALVDCQKLIFLEVNWSELRDYSPLVELKALEDLNLHRTYADITPLLEMHWLKNLWVPGRSYQERQQLIEALPNTNLELNSHNTRGWRHLPNYYDMRDVLGMRYMTQ